MFQQERHEQILARLNTDGKVKVNGEVTTTLGTKMYLSKKYITYNYYKYD